MTSGDPSTGRAINTFNRATFISPQRQKQFLCLTK